MIAELRESYARGALVQDVIEATLAALKDAPSGVLIGDPLVERARADAARLARLAPDSLPLYGVPFVVKDNIDVAGHPTTAGCPGFAYPATSDATTVRLLRAAGAVVVGKTNLDQFATGLVGTRSPFGTPPNAIDPALIPGGSSSGSAVAVALGLVPFALGTDTAGSGRVPAALNGIVGLKPTLGSSSAHGIVPAVRRLDCPSVFARSVADAALVARTIRGVDVNDPFTRRWVRTPPFRTRAIVGVPARWNDSLDLSEPMRVWFRDALVRLGDLGVELEEVDIGPLLEAGRRLYGSPVVAERTASVGDAVARRVAGLDPVVARIIAAGAEMSAVDAYRGEYELATLRAAAREVWESIDVLALPTTPRVPTLADVAAEPVAQNDEVGRFTTFVNLLDLAALVVPTGPEPAGVQLIGPAWSDDELIRIGAGLEHGSLEPAVQPCTVVVVGAHMSGLPLNGQLTELRASFVGTVRTAPEYRLYALPGTTPPKPGMVRVGAAAGVAIEGEMWSMGEAELGAFVARVPAPLCIGSIALCDGRVSKGFLCEANALTGALDISEHRNWRAYLHTVPSG